MNNRKTADRLIDLRMEKQLTQVELAKILGKSKQMISFYESGDKFPSVEMLEKYADFFGVTTDYLLGRTDCRSPNISIRGICDYLGLSEASVMQLHEMNDMEVTVNKLGKLIGNNSLSSKMDIINYFIESDLLSICVLDLQSLKQYSQEVMSIDKVDKDNRKQFEESNQEADIFRLRCKDTLDDLINCFDCRKHDLNKYYKLNNDITDLIKEEYNQFITE